MQVRIAHISDTHLGTRPRDGIRQNVWGIEMRTQLLENDFYERFAELFKIISQLEPRVDIVIHSGDLYNSPWEGNPLQPPVVSQEVAISVLKDFIESTGIPVLIIEGNHGLYRNWDVSLLDGLQMAVPGLHVVTQQELKRAIVSEKPVVRTFESLDVFCYPFIDKHVLESSNLLEEYHDWIMTCQKPDPKRISVAVAHGMTLDETLPDAMFSLQYDYFALGHDHHQHKHAKNAWYAGSPERWRFDETRHEKGFLVVDITDNHSVSIKPHHLDFTRPVYNDKISIESDDTVDSVLEKVEAFFEANGIKAGWDSATAARVRLVFEGSSSKVNLVDLNVSLESLRMRVLANESGYNIAQMKWTVRTPTLEGDAASYPEIESEYLIEDPEQDFLAYLETVKIDDRYDPALLTKIAVSALKKSVTQDDEKMTLETITEEGSD